VYSVHLHGENLHTDFRVFNEDDAPFEFTAALHSYFEVRHSLIVMLDWFVGQL